MGNKSFFRNEKINGKSFVMSPEWQLPTNGVFEFDFMYLQDVPDPEQAISDDHLNLLVEWFRAKAPQAEGAEENKACEPL